MDKVEIEPVHSTGNKMPTDEKRERLLRKWYWFVKPGGSYCQRAIIEQMERMGAVAEGEGTIPYKGTVTPGIHIGQRYPIVEWLAKNKSETEGFEAWHSDFRDGPWEKWREGKKTSKEKLKASRKSGLLRKGARMFRSRSK